jgi:hypothetical protein
MKVYGNLMNRLMEGKQPVEPEVGMGATMTSYSDRHAGTIIEKLANGVIAVQEDKAKRIDNNGMSDSQSYEYTANPNGAISYFRKNKDGRWVQVYLNSATGRWKIFDGGNGLRLGERDKFYDFSF